MQFHKTEYLYILQFRQQYVMSFTVELQYTIMAFNLQYLIKL